RRNRDAPRLLLRCIVDLVVTANLAPELRRHYLRQSRRQRRLAMVNMANRPNIHMRLRSFKFSFRHVLISRGTCFKSCMSPASPVPDWSPHPDLNRGPLPYQGSALPLSYVGKYPGERPYPMYPSPVGAGDGNRTHIISLEG